MDPIDKQILQLLGKDARQGCDIIAKGLHLSPSTVRRRIRKLTQSGVLQIVPTVDPDSYGLPLMAIVAFDIAMDKIDLALQQLAARPEVRWLSTTTGEFDLLALTRFRSTEEFSEFLEKELVHIEGIKDTKTFICLNVKKGKYMQVI